MKRIALPLLLFLLSLAATGGYAQTASDIALQDRGARPRIGLVLGGGGARGAAHIGVLRELERLHVPIDAIAGTSMGAIVGGLYAAGKTPDELEEIVGSLDWNASFQDRPPRRDLPFRRKQDEEAYPVRLELGLRDGSLQIPLGLIQGQKLSYILRELTAATAGITDFDKLPIPFRAVASDIQSGEPYVMSSGNLALAMRASMSAPGIFSPVIVDGHTLVDGGLVGNVPVDAIQSMDVDVIIAVDVEFPLYESNQLQSALDITAQMLTVLIRKETRRQLEALDDDDVLIRPDLGQFGSTNFGQIRDAIDPGAAAARENEDRLRELSVGDEEWQSYLVARQVGELRERTIDFIRVDDDGPIAARVLEARLQTKVGDTLDSDALASDSASLFGLDLYEQVDYHVVTEGQRTGVVFDTRPKAWGPNYLRFGIGLEDDFEGATAFNISTRLTRTGMNRLGAEWRSDLQLGTEPLLVSEFYQPLGFDARYFIAPRFDLGQSNVRSFVGDVSNARYRLSESEFGIDAGRELGRYGEFRVGAFRGSGSAILKVGDASLPNFYFDTGGFFANLSIDTLDDAQIPRDGMRLGVRWELERPGLGADTGFDAVSSELSLVETWGRHTFQLGVDFSTTTESNDQLQNLVRLGGFLNMSGLARGEIAGAHAGIAKLVWYRRSGETGGGVFDVPLYLGASLEAGNVWQQRSDIELRSLLTSGSVFAGLDTYFGPLFLAAGFAESGKTNFYLSLGTPLR